MQNPLRRYKDSNPEMEWQSIAGATGITVQTLIAVAKKTPDEVGGVSIATAARLKSKIGVDLIDFYSLHADASPEDNRNLGGQAQPG